MSPEKTVDPRPMLERLQELVPKMIRGKIKQLEREYGASDFGIEGVVVVGSVAARKEQPGSDVDLYVISCSEGYDHTFVAALSKKLGVPVERLGTIRTDKSEAFKPQDWHELMKQKGHQYKDFIEIRA